MVPKPPRSNRPDVASNAAEATDMRVQGRFGIGSCNRGLHTRQVFSAFMVILLTDWRMGGGVNAAAP